MAGIECGGFLFYSNFDSGNLSKVEWVPKNESAVVLVLKNGKEVPEVPDMEFNIWTRPDCMGTEFENGNRTWFYFGVKSYLPFVLVKFNLVDLNRQAKMYSQGMAPVFRMVPGRPNWDRVRDKPTYTITDNIFTLSFKFRTPENIETIMYFAFTYPYSYTELQASLISMDNRFFKRPSPHSYDDIYYVRECVCKSLENRRVDLITISSYYNITADRETRLNHLFPEEHVLRPFKFYCKKVIFLSARVHPGETPASFVFNGLLHFLLTRDDPVAILLRRMYVFKMIPFLNPDGVVKGHYRTDTRGVNLNRMYLCPTLAEHPSIYAARALIQYYHKGYEADDNDDVLTNDLSNEATFTSDNNKMTQQVEVLSLNEKDLMAKRNSEPWCSKSGKDRCRNCDAPLLEDGLKNPALKRPSSTPDLCSLCMDSPTESGLFLYLDMHGHASKKGIFMYGNHFTDIERNVECMLLPKIISLNNHNFHFTSCNFTERNMYLRDRRDGMSREGSGRVAVLKLTGLIQSYTLECNYNSGRVVNVLPPMVKEINKNVHTMPIPPKYTPHIFEEVGRAICVSILDLTNHNPNSRLPNSEFHSLSGLQEWLRVNCLNDYSSPNRISHRSKLPPNSHSQTSTKPARVKALKTLAIRARPSTLKSNTKKQTTKSDTPVIPIERKENMVFGAKESNLTSQSSSSPSSAGARIFSQSVNRNKNLSLRSRSKRDLTRSKVRLKKNPDTPQMSNRSVQTSKTSFELEPSSSKVKVSPKRIKVTPDSASGDRLKLREICIIKENLGKKLIAKFEKLDKKESHDDDDDDDDDDDLVVAWDSNYSPKVLSQSGRGKGESSTGKRGGYKTATFAKSKMVKGNIRRLTSVNIEATGKIEKFKKRRKKSKIL